jgi:enoyl-CoA hydratase/carnithine racemase
MAEPGRITTERNGHVLSIGIDRVSKRNAFSLGMYHELGRALHILDKDPDMRCGVLFAHGDHFTAGIDLMEFAPEFAKGYLAFPENEVDPMGLLGGRVTKPVVMAVQGLCLTVGVELMLAMDIRVAASDTRFGQIEVQRGILPVGGATLRFARECGWGNAMRYLLTGDMFGADDALRIGLVQEVVPPGRQVERAMEIAAAIAEQAPLAVQASLESARQELAHGEAEAARNLFPMVRSLLGTEDVQEGLASFLERRKATFQGR